ncbi:MAG: TIM barrel protein [Novosphingobium sp.]
MTADKDANHFGQIAPPRSDQWENNRMNRLGIDRLSTFGMPPVEFVDLAADLGCGQVGIALAPMAGYNPHGFPDWSLRDDAALRRAMVAALEGRGLAIGMVEGFALVPERDIRDCAADLDLVCELGAARIACVSLDKDLARTVDGFAVLAEMAAARGLLVCAEMGSLGPYGRVEAALEMAEGIGMSNFSLMLDAMHYFRMGNTNSQLAKIDPALIGYVQLCDVPWKRRFETYMEEAMYERMVPGEGELPLREFVSLLPADVVVSLEVPIRSLAEQGIGPRERLAPCVAAARALLEG